MKTGSDRSRRQGSHRPARKTRNPYADIPVSLLVSIGHVSRTATRSAVNVRNRHSRMTLAGIQGRLVAYPAGSPTKALGDDANSFYRDAFRTRLSVPLIVEAFFFRSSLTPLQLYSKHMFTQRPGLPNDDCNDYALFRIKLVTAIQ